MLCLKVAYHLIEPGTQKTFAMFTQNIPTLNIHAPYLLTVFALRLNKTVKKATGWVANNVDHNADLCGVWSESAVFA